MSKNAERQSLLASSQDAPIIVASAVMPSYGTGAVVIVDEETPILLAEAQVDEAFELVDGSPVFHNFFFALLFYAHFALMIWLGVAIAPQGFDKIDLNYTSTIIENALRNRNDDYTNDDISEEDIQEFADFVHQGAPSFLQVYPLRIFFLLIIPCHFTALTIAYFELVYIIKAIPKTVIYSFLIKSLILSTGLAIFLAVLSGSVLVWFIAVITILAMLYYTAIGWRYAPYAAVNLKVALTGIYSNFGVNLVAATFAKLGVIWTIYWLYVTIGVFGYMGAQCRETHPDGNFDMTSPDFDNSCNPPVMVVLLFLLSLYWTSVVTTVCV
jgi:hypothetical protein